MSRVSRTRLVGEHARVAVERALAEFRSGRPVLISSTREVITAMPVDGMTDAPRMRTRVEGPICESTDALGEHELPPFRRGDFVAIADTGAYAASLSSTYNGRPRAAHNCSESLAPR